MNTAACTCTNHSLGGPPRSNGPKYVRQKPAMASAAMSNARGMTMDGRSDRPGCVLDKDVFIGFNSGGLAATLARRPARRLRKPVETF
jgi:hypothetical protein